MNNNFDPKEGEVKEANAPTGQPVNTEGDNAGEATPVDSEEGGAEG